jgi:hypothetical protein
MLKLRAETSRAKSRVECQSKEVIQPSRKEPRIESRAELTTAEPKITTAEP